MGKTSKQESTQQIDPMIRAEMESIFGSGRDIAAMGYNPYTGMNISDFAEGQKAAFQSADDASAAFGMQGGAMRGMPTPDLEGPYGIRGYSNESTMQQQGGIDPRVKEALDEFYMKAGQHTPYQAPLGSSGGKK